MRVGDVFFRIGQTPVGIGRAADDGAVLVQHELRALAVFEPVEIRDGEREAHCAASLSSARGSASPAFTAQRSAAFRSAALPAATRIAPLANRPAALRGAGSGAQ